MSRVLLTLVFLAQLPLAPLLTSHCHEAQPHIHLSFLVGRASQTPSPCSCGCVHGTTEHEHDDDHDDDAVYLPRVDLVDVESSPALDSPPVSLVLIDAGDLAAPGCSFSRRGVIRPPDPPGFSHFSRLLI